MEKTLLLKFLLSPTLISINTEPTNSDHDDDENSCWGYYDHASIIEHSTASSSSSSSSASSWSSSSSSSSLSSEEDNWVGATITIIPFKQTTDQEEARYSGSVAV